MGGRGNTTFWNPERLPFRLTMLIGICFLTFGSYFVYDIPSALQTPLINEMHLTDFQYGTLYSVYSWPNIILALIGGFLIDRVFGIRLGAIVFCTLVFIGQFIFSIGVSRKSFLVAAAGRLIFGLGGESLSVAQSTYTAKWFTGKELALAFGIALSFSRVGSAVNFNLTPYLASKLSVSLAVWIGAAICLISMAFALLLAFWDYKGTQHRMATNTMPPHSEEKIELKDVKDFPLSLWILVFICIAFYIPVFIFIQYGGGFFGAKWGLGLEKRDSLLSIPSLFSAGASPFLGAGVDFLGRSLTWVTLACAVLSGVHLYMNFAPATTVGFPIGGMVTMGAAYSICAAALWPCVALIMPTHQLGTAYGLMTAMQNFGLAIAPLIIGEILTVTHNNYTLMEYIFAGVAAFACLLSVILILVDLARNQGVLNASPARRKELQGAQEERERLIVNNEEPY